MTPTAEQKRRWARVSELGCLACRREFGDDAEYPPASVHHCRHNCGLAQRNHDEVAPLCPQHHQWGPISRHGSPAAFAVLYGDDARLHAETKRLLGEDG